MMKPCQRCGVAPKRNAQGGLTMHDYCAVCSCDLCPTCMAQGCCGNVPALSEWAEDDGPATSQPTRGEE